MAVWYQNLQNYLYQGSYLIDKGIRIKYVDELTKFFVSKDEKRIHLLLTKDADYQLVPAIILRFGHQWLARDYLETTQNLLYPQKPQYHFDAFTIFTKSNFDFIAHLINGVLSLGHQSRYVDLNRPDFRNDVLLRNYELGSVINNHSPWIREITAFRTAIEHQKIVPITYFDPATLREEGQVSKEMRIPSSPISYGEMLRFIFHGGTYETKEVMPFCDSSLKKTQEIIENTFRVVYEKLTKNVPQGNSGPT